MAPSDKDIPLTRAIGRFFGHLWHAAAKPAPADTHTETVSRTTESAPGEIDGRPVTLRRTVIEEVTFEPPPTGREQGR